MISHDNMEMEEVKLDKETRDEVWESVEFNSFTTRENSIDGREQRTIYADSQFEPGRSVGDYGLQELVICPHESDYQIIRDICMDGEIPFPNECSIENCELDHIVISSMLNSGVETDSKSTKESLTSISSLSNSSEPSSEHNCIEDVFNHCGSTEKSTTANYSHSQLLNSHGDRGEQKDYQVPTSVVSSATDQVDSKSEVETRTSTKKEVPETATDSQPPHKIVNSSLPKDGISESSIVSSQTHDRGEASFSAASNISGPISYSGSISLRSNSCNSNNSTRSFTFPVLPSDWYDSPVRMVEADKRALTKHRRWKMALTKYRRWKSVFGCCKF